MRDDNAQAEVRPLGSDESLNEDEEFFTSRAYTEEELERAKNAPDKVVTGKPPMLGYASTIFIIINRMLGTGAFRSATTIAQATHSIAWTLGFWTLGGVHSIAGAYVFAELGLTLPRLDVNQEGIQFVPRNGGEVNYLQYFAKEYELLATCVYGIPFVFVGCIAPNTLIFARSVLGANGNPVNDGAMRGVAIAVAGFACALHATWRKAGLFVNNVFGAVKVAMLFTLFALGLSYLGGAFGGSTATAIHNLSSPGSMEGSSTSAYSYAQSWLAILFTFGGFHQASYVLAEVRDCRRRFKVTSLSTVTFISIMFFLLQLSFMFVVPKETQYAEDLDDSVARPFFAILFGITGGRKVQSAFMAFTSLGNIIVHTFTAARVKQEIAKTGILVPFSQALSKNYRLTPKFLRSKSKKGAQESEDTPAAAFLMHFIFTVILIVATIPAGEDSYRILVGLYSFVINAVFGFLVGLGVLHLRLRKSSGWREMSSANPWLSIIAAAVYTIGNLFPLIGIWIPPGAKQAFLAAGKYWYTIGTVGVCLIALGALWWVLIEYVIPPLTGKKLETDREYNFITDRGNWVVWHDIVSIRWPSPEKAE